MIQDIELLKQIIINDFFIETVPSADGATNFKRKNSTI